MESSNLTKILSVNILEHLNLYDNIDLTMTVDIEICGQYKDILTEFTTKVKTRLKSLFTIDEIIVIVDYQNNVYFIDTKIEFNYLILPIKIEGVSGKDLIVNLSKNKIIGRGGIINYLKTLEFCPVDKSIYPTYSTYHITDNENVVGVEFFHNRGTEYGKIIYYTVVITNRNNIKYMNLYTCNKLIFEVEIEDFSIGVDHLIFFNSSGVYTWGNNKSGQLGIGNYDDFNELSKIDFNPTAVGAGNGYSLILEGTNLYGCGNNVFGKMCSLNSRGSSRFKLIRRGVKDINVLTDQTILYL